MKLRNVLTILFVIVCTATVASSSSLAQETQTASARGPAQPAAEPLTKKRLLKLLTLNDSSPQELIQIVGQKGVDFQPAPANERELHDAGASDDLIVAVRANYRGGASQSNAQVNQQQNTSADTNGQAAQSPANSSTGSAQAPKKKGFLSKVNDKLNKVNSTLAQQAGTTQPPATDQPTTTTPQTVALAGPANAAAAADSQTAAAQTGPAQPAQKKGFLSKLNNGLDKANDKLTKVAATLNPVVAQTGAPNQPTPDTTQTTTIAPANRNATTAPATTQVAQTPAGDATSGSAPATLAGTYWNMTSMTTKGETEKKSDAPGPDVEFCRDGKWGMLHYGGAREAGTYQMQGGRLIMKMEDGSLFGNFQIKRNGNEMTLDDGKYLLRMKYIHPAGC